MGICNSLNNHHTSNIKSFIKENSNFFVPKILLKQENLDENTIIEQNETFLAEHISIKN